MEQLEQQLLEWVTQIFNAFSWPGVVGLMAIESAGIPFPSEIIMPVSGWILVKNAGHGVSFVLLAAFYGALGNVIGSVIAYWVAAKGGLPLLQKYGKYLLITGHDLDRAHRWFAKHGDWAIFFSRLLPVVRTFISFPAGVARMNIYKFIIYTFVGSYIWSLGLAFGGYMLGEQWDEIRKVMRPFDIPILIAFFLLLLLYIRRQRKRIIMESRKADPGQEDKPH